MGLPNDFCGTLLREKVLAFLIPSPQPSPGGEGVNGTVVV